LINALQACVDNRAIRRVVRLKQPASFETFIGYLRMIQSWSMFGRMRRSATAWWSWTP
jgi:hypothetical protein